MATTVGHSLDQPLAGAGIRGLTRETAAKLARRLEIHTIRDLLEHVPRRYLDLSRTQRIGDLRINEEATVLGQVHAVASRPLRGRRHLVSVTINDGSGYLEAVWWNQPYRARAFREGQTVALAGRIERLRYRGRLGITNPFVEVVRDGNTEGVHTAAIIPIHPATEGISAAQIRRYVHTALQRWGGQVPDPVPPALAQRHRLLPRADALRDMHFPSSLDARRAALRRLVYEELLVLSTGLAIRKRRIERETPGIAHTGSGELLAAFLEALPFPPTGAQRRAIEEIRTDLGRPRPMNRLLQGEVGSGKTVVAVAAALVVAESGGQTAIMAPTEVLAEQHLLSLRSLLSPLEALRPGEGRLFGGGIEVALLTGSQPAGERERVRERLSSGEASIVIGTHALIQEGVEIPRLGLAIVDEQHRFGVHQRVALRARGAETGALEPDALIMTATPIPRTIALTLYGDLDVSVLDEMPPGRTPAETRVARTPAEREAAYDLVRREVAAGHQAFVVCPLVAESDTLQAKAAETEAERIRSEVLPDLRVGLLHGRMRPAEKEAVMTAMRAGEVDVLVATTVVEVGVDVPNATVMLIEDADRFGLSQLHQLRGRVGRGGDRSWCVLLTGLDEGEEEERRLALRRLQAMASTTDGFALAEEDLRIRGEGQIFGRGRLDEGGTAPVQTGRSDLRFARLLRDGRALVAARRDAFEIVDQDPALSQLEHRALAGEVRRRFADRLDWLFAS